MTVQHDSWSHFKVDFNRLIEINTISCKFCFNWNFITIKNRSEKKTQKPSDEYKDRCNTLSTVTTIVCCTTWIVLTSTFIVKYLWFIALEHVSFFFCLFLIDAKDGTFTSFPVYHHSPLCTMYIEHIKFLTRNYNANDRAYAIDCLLRKWRAKRKKTTKQ